MEPVFSRIYEFRILTHCCNTSSKRFIDIYEFVALEYDYNLISETAFVYKNVSLLRTYRLIKKLNKEMQMNEGEHICVFFSFFTLILTHFLSFVICFIFAVYPILLSGITNQ
jgi:hypothetical protein